MKRQLTNKPIHNFSERDITHMLISQLNYRGFIVWRHNVTAIGYERKNGSVGRVMFGRKGDSDIMGFQKKTGRFIVVEVKKPGYKPSDVSPQQEEFINMVTYFGGIGFVASSIEEMEEKLKTFYD